MLLSFSLSHLGHKPRWSDISLLLFLLTWALRSALCYPPPGVRYRLNGMETAFLQLSDWTPAVNWNLTFEFRTHHSTGLLLYADDVRRRAFVLVRLVEAESTQEQIVECRLQIPIPPTVAVTRHHEHHLTLHLTRPPHDHHWSLLQLTLQSNVFSMSLSTTKGRDVVQRTLPTGRVFAPPVRINMGGMPGNQSSSPPLTHPSVMFEPRFRGVLRRVSYDTGSGSSVEVVGHGGMEIIPEVSLCEKETLAGENDFWGREYLTFFLPFSTTPLDTASEYVHISFRSRQADGIIVYGKTSTTGFLTFYLQNGRLIFAAKFASYTVKEKFEPDVKKDFRDYAVYNVSLHLQNDPPEITISINGKSRAKHLVATGDKAEEIGQLTTLLLGGVSDVDMDESKTDNGETFQGTVLDFLFQRGTKHRDLLVQAVKRYHHPNISENTSVENVYFTCQTNARRLMGPVNFCQDNQHLSVSTGNKKFKLLSLKFKTTEPHGLLMFHRENNHSLTAVDMFEGQLGLLIKRSGVNHLEEPSRIAVSSAKANDGVWHELTLQLDERSGIGQIQLDDAATEFIIGVNEPATILYTKLPVAPHNEPSKNVYIGGAPSSLTTIFPDIWSVQTGGSFRGLIKKIVFNKKPVDISEQLDGKWTCPDNLNVQRYCDANPCLNAGKCREGWQRYICDCDHTAFAGQNCETASLEMHFDETNPYVKYELPTEAIHNRQVTSLSFRFRSFSMSAFIGKLWCLHKTTGSGADDAILVGLVNGKLKVTLTAAALSERLEWTVGEGLNDDKWHAVAFHRHGRFIKILLDTYELTETAGTLDGIALHYCRLDLGKPPGQRSKKYIRASRLPLTPPLRPSTPPSTLHLPAFRGRLQKLLLDKQDILSRIHNAAELNVEQQVFSVRTPEAFVTLDALQGEKELDIRLAFRTVQANGLMLFNGKYAQDFIAVELVHGVVHLTFDMGNGAQVLASNTRKPLNDNTWHTVHITRPTPTDHILTVDGEKWILVNLKEKSRLNLHGPLYIGGLPGLLFPSLPRSIRSQTGFSGCLSAVTLNGRVTDLVNGVRTPSDMVLPGCAGPQGECGRGAPCQNGGRCVQQWMGFGCDCDMTSFTGESCSSYSSAYRFGPLPGMVIYHFDADQRPDSRADRIGFGLVTTEDEALVCRIASFTSEDVIEFQIVAGHMFVVYNMGNYAHLISDMQHRLNDGTYHVVRFERDGPNTTLQIDGNEKIIKTPTGKQHDTFNGISTVEIGGRLNARQDDIDRAFQGIVAGFVINGIRILDLAADAHSNVLLEGHPELVSDLQKELHAFNASETLWKQLPEWMEQMQQTDVTQTGDWTTSDDLFTATPGPCKAEGNGCTLADGQKGDDLIFASFTLVTTTTTLPKTTTTTPLSSTTAKRVISSPRSVICDDDEDCDIEASGDPSPLAARSALARSTRPPIIINVTFTTPPAVSTPASHFRTTETFQSSLHKPTFTVTPPPGKLGPLPTFPTVLHVSSTVASVSSPLDVFREHAALIAGLAVGLIVLVALVVFLAVRYRKKRTAPPVEGAKTYQTFTKPEPSPAGTLQRNGHARTAQAGGVGSTGRGKEKEYYV